MTSMDIHRCRQISLRAQGSHADPPKSAGAVAWRDEYAASLVGDDPAFVRLLATLMRVASRECDVLLTGESGTGKELAARAIHAASARREGPFVAMNCAAIPKELVEAEMFGSVKGAYTGATETRAGRFLMADGGTLFLDEIGEMDFGLQAKFLRVVQEREVTAVGHGHTRKINVRIIAASNEDLGKLCAEGAFRKDLYYRIHVVPVHMPALRERSSDVARLADVFLQQAAERHARSIGTFTQAAHAVLAAYPWPGNIRELRNLVERVVVLKPDDGAIDLGDLPPEIVTPAPAHADGLDGIGADAFMALPDGGLDIRATIEAMEARLTREALQRAAGNKAKAAALLGLKRTTLIERLRKLNIDPAIDLTAA